MFSGKKLQLFTVIKKNMQIDLCMCATETAKCRRGGEMKATAACARASGCYDGCEGERAGVPASKPWFAIAYANTHIHIHTCIHNFCICAHIICCNFVLPHAIKSARVTCSFMLERETGPPPLIKGFAQSLVTIENDLQNATNCAATWCVWVRAREVYPVAERERRIRRLGLRLANLYLLYR